MELTIGGYGPKGEQSRIRIPLNWALIIATLTLAGTIVTGIVKTNSWMKQAEQSDVDLGKSLEMVSESLTNLSFKVESIGASRWRSDDQVSWSISVERALQIWKAAIEKELERTLRSVHTESIEINLPAFNMPIPTPLR